MKTVSWLPIYNLTPGAGRLDDCGSFVAHGSVLHRSGGPQPLFSSLPYGKEDVCFDVMQPELIKDEKRSYCMIIPRSFTCDTTTFFSADDDLLQVGFVCREAGQGIPRHDHLERVRTIDRTWEFLLVRSGSMTMSIYNDDRKPIAERRLETGDAVLLMGGGHGFVAHKELTLLEVKQGPFQEGRDKERF